MRTDCINFSIYIENYNFISDISQYLADSSLEKKGYQIWKYHPQKKSEMDENANEENKQLIVN